MVYLPNAASPADLAIADVDHDGKPDIGVAQKGLNSVAVYRQASTGGYTIAPATYAVGKGPSALVALDLDYTGKNADFVVACGGDGSFYALSNTNVPDGTLKVGDTWYYYGPAYGPNPRMTVGYIDRDTKPDLLFGLSTPSPGMRSWNYQGAGNWQTGGPVRTGDIPSGILLNDLDGDSFPDIAASLPTTNEVIVFRHDGTNASFPYFTTANTSIRVPTLGLGPVDVATTDLNGDSRPDLLTANEGDNTVSLLLGTGAAKFGTAVLVHQAAAPRKVLAADLDGDQRPELVTINADNTLNVYHNTGLSGPDRYGTPLTLATGTDPTALRIADLNNDRKLDLAVTCAGDNTVRLYYNTTGSALANRAPMTSSLVMFPNPATTTLSIKLPPAVTTTSGINVSLINLTGQLISTQRLDQNLTIDVHSLPRGMYIAKVLTANGILTQKVELR